MATHRVVVLGGGFAGVYTAKRLLHHARSLRRQGHELEVHLVNRENYMVFQPMLAEVISGSVGIADTVSPLRRLIRDAFIHMRDIEEIDLAGGTVTLTPGFKPRATVLPFDHLVLAMGNVTDFRGAPGLPEHALPFKTLGDAIALRNHVLRLLDEADNETDPDLRRQMLTFVVAGGGFSGVEVMAEMHDFVLRIVDGYPHIQRQECKFILIHSRDRILPEVSPELAIYAQKLLAKRGIEIWLSKRLVAASASNAILGDGTRVPTRTLVSTVPSNPNPLIEGLSLPKENGRLLAEGTTLVTGTRNIWALGDCARIPLPLLPGQDKPEYAPPTAQHAIREATICADNIVATIRHQPLKLFSFRGLGTLAALGHRRGVAQIMGFKISGLLAWFIWRTVYWAKLPGWDRKAKVGASWFIDLFFPPDLVQLRLGTTSAVHHEHYEAGQTVFEQGDLGQRMYIIIKGKVEVLQTTADGEQIVLGSLGPGQYFGEMALMKRRPRSATIRCVEPLDVLSLEKADFTAMIEHVDAFRAGFEREAERRTTIANAAIATAEAAETARVASVASVRDRQTLK